MALSPEDRKQFPDNEELFATAEASEHHQSPSEPAIENILDRAGTRPRDEWSGLIDDVCQDRPELEGEALLLLEMYDELGTPDSVEELLDSQPPPDENGRYEYRRRLDSGGSADVWRAFDTKLSRYVAIKVFRDNVGSVEQVLSEATAASYVVSDHVVRIHDVHEEASRPYIVMELVGEFDDREKEIVIGESAATQRPRTIEEAASWVISVARGIQDAHLRDVFHGDIKPRNVMITPVSREARVTDFGLNAQSGDHDDACSTTVTSLVSSDHGLRRIAGTPPFMSPEQARGVSPALDPHDERDRGTLVGIDVYGIGALAYQFMSDRAPYEPGEGETSWDVWQRICDGDRPSPLRSVRSHRLGRLLIAWLASSKRPWQRSRLTASRRQHSSPMRYRTTWTTARLPTR